MKKFYTKIFEAINFIYDVCFKTNSYRFILYI